MADHLFQVSLFPSNGSGVPQAIASLTALTSPVIAIDRIERVEAIVFQLASAGTADVKIAWAGGHSSVSNYPPLVFRDPPVVMESFADNPLITASTNTDFSTDPKGLHKYPFPAVLQKYLQVQITGVGANDASTTILSWLIFREKVHNVGP